MSDFKVGDKVRLNDDGFWVLPGPLNRHEADIFRGVLTVKEVVECPTNEEPDAQYLWFDEMEYSVPSEGVDMV